MKRTQIVIVGAGPTGLEAALAASEAGLDFTVFEADTAPGGNVRAWGHVGLFTPWSMNASPRARARLSAGGMPAPDGDACPTGHELVDHVLGPLAALPDIAPNIHYGTRVLQIGRDGYLKSDEIGTGRRAERPFRLLVEDARGERVVFADVVLDCSGTYHNPNALGTGGILAPGERSVADRITRLIPDVDGEPNAWAGKRILLVGAGHSGQTAACSLATLAERHSSTAVTWAIRGEDRSFGALEDDGLPVRAELASSAAEIATQPASGVRVLWGSSVDALRDTDDGIEVTLRAAEAPDADPETIEVDEIIALTGSVGDHAIYRQLQVHECYATSGPMKLAAALLADTAADCLQQESGGADTLRSPEPNFFMLGEKSYGRNTTFLMSVGWQQVSEVFSTLRRPATSGAESR